VDGTSSLRPEAGLSGTAGLDVPLALGLPVLMLLGRERRDPQVMAGSFSLAEGARLAARAGPATEGDDGTAAVGEAALPTDC
jgi:hypothetical protein